MKNIDVIMYLKFVTIKDAIYWISDAWDEITTSTIFKCWKNILLWTSIKIWVVWIRSLIFE